MTTNECKAFVDATLPALVDELMLERWKIECDYDARLDGSTLAEVNLDSDYLSAFIRFDARKISDESELKLVLIHELSHIILAPIEFYRNLKSQDNDLEQRLWTHALENVVTHLERIFIARQDARNV
jgi:hypothetical protein